MKQINDDLLDTQLISLHIQRTIWHFNRNAESGRSFQQRNRLERVRDYILQAQLFFMNFELILGHTRHIEEIVEKPRDSTNIRIYNPDEFFVSAALETPNFFNNSR